MQAAVLTQYNQIQLQEAPDPKIDPGQVLVRVAYASICGTDQHIFKGDFHPRTRLPFIPGHEFAGTVAEIGSEVSADFKIQTGDKVAVDPIIWCGQCPACRRQHYPACSSLKLLGVDLDGGFAQYVAADPGQIYKVSPDTDLRHAALVEILAIGFHASNRAQIEPDDTIAIHGAGKVGQCILQAARTKTQNQIFVVDTLDERLAIAKKAYPEIIVINPHAQDPVEVIRKETNGDGVDIAFEAVGHPHPVPDRPHPIRSAIQSIRGAGKVVVLGLADEPAPIVFKEMIFKEARIIASRVSHGEFAEVIENLERGALNPEALVSDVLPPAEISQAFQILEDDPQNHLKILLDFT